MLKVKVEEYFGKYVEATLYDDSNTIFRSSHIKKIKELR